MYQKKSAPKAEDISYQRVKSYMLWLIERYGDYSAKKLQQKADFLFKADRQYNESALAYLIERGIVNDLRYAKRLTESLAEKNIGVNKIKEKLYSKGFCRQTIAACVGALPTTEQDYFDKALTLKVKKFGAEPISDIKLQQKALRHLISKGFSYGIAKQVISHVSEPY
ncbi:regulatory protein [Colwellia chukchiensis]|uniref:Regulatory protein RecX n=1 Tax=Colwellia chukchiensis TaxID=641665 RepID=A0A1H7RY94_9GAMM|nr:regulatory protein RecX [Colwellia chukchiensis]SEL64347.1 regulatory protein [Colwellia chukchiensis]